MLREKKTRLLAVDASVKFGSLVIATSAILIGWNLMSEYQLAIETARTLIRQSVTIAEKEISGGLRTAEQLLKETEAESRKADQKYIDGATQYLKTKLKVFPELRAIGLSTREGKVRYSSFNNNKGFDISSRPYYLIPKAGESDKTYLTGPTKVRDGSVVYFLSRKIVNDQGEFQGVVAASLSSKFFDRVLRQITPEGENFSGVATSEGKILWRFPNPEKFLGISMANEPGFVAHKKSGKQISDKVAAMPNAAENLIFFINVEKFPLMVASGRDMKEIMAPWWQSLLFHAIAFALVCLLTVIIVWSTIERGRERLRAHTDLKASQSRLANILDIAPEAVIAIGNDKNIQLFNQGAEQIFGHRAEDILGKSVGVLMPENMRERAILDIDSLINSRLVNRSFVDHSDSRGQRKDGGVFPTIVSVSKFDDGNESIITFVIQDVTERNKIEDELRKSREELEVRVRERTTDLENSERRANAIISSSGEGIITIDEHGTIETFNPAARKMFGYEIEEALGKNVSILMPEDDRRLHNSYLAKANTYADRVINKSRDLHGQRKNGEIFPMELFVSPMEIDDNQKFVGITKDITERKTNENELNLSREMAERSNRAKSEFLSSMSHELRTPMNAIMGFGQLLQNNPKEPLSDKQLDHTQQILKGGDHLLELIDQVLELSKIESGKINLSMENVASADVIDEGCKFVETHAGEKSIIINFRRPEANLPILWTDRSRFLQILLNLFSNAIKYNRVGGKVSITTEILETGFLRVSVTDTGFGIPEHQRKNLFEPFNRLGRENGDIEGTGIGLTITREIVDKLGGKLDFESEEGVGSTFSIELPISESQSLPDVKINGNDFEMMIAKAGKMSGKLLCVEDNPANLRLIKDVVERIPDVTLVSANNAEMGLKMARDLHPDLILMDINLPGMDGITALRKLRQDKETKNIPVIAISAAAMPHEIELGNEAGFENYITKPINIPEMLESICSNLKA